VANVTVNRKRIAVIGAGVSGLTAAYVLHRAADVTLYEADDRLGGHAHTHDVASGGRTFAVDSGFIVHNERTYPQLLRLFRELGVATRETEMSMSVSCRQCGLEYAGARGVSGAFAKPGNATNGRYLNMLRQVPVFQRRARALLAAGDLDPEPTLGQFIAAGGYSRYFTRHFIVPLVSAVWSCGPQMVSSYPARYLFSFLANHGMLTVNGSPIWRTVVGGSRSYVDLVAKRLKTVRAMAPVRAVHRHVNGVDVHDESDAVERYDSVVVATHADQALALLSNPSHHERDVLGAFGYSSNETILHTDPSVLPRHRAARSSWNYMLPKCAPASGVAQVSYYMNTLQRLDSDTDFVVTLGRSDEIDPSRVLARMNYTHPIYTPSALSAQRRLCDIASSQVAFAGAYHGWGFHEDGCRSGVNAAERLGVRWC
jgi:uncharacterized protein